MLTTGYFSEFPMKNMNYADNSSVFTNPYIKRSFNSDPKLMKAYYPEENF